MPENNSSGAVAPPLLPAQAADRLLPDARWIVTAQYDTRSDMLTTYRPVPDIGRLIMEVYEAAVGGATLIKVRPHPMPKLASSHEEPDNAG